MATVCATRVNVPPPPPPPAARSASTPPPPHLSINTSPRGTPAAVPNKHLAKFPTIHKPSETGSGSSSSSAPTSPPTPSQLIETTSLTYPPTGFERLADDPPVYSISAAKLARALEHIESQPLPSTKQVFPWLHGLHAENALQLAFFTARRKSLRRTPKCIRGLTVVKVGDPLHSKLKGAITPEEILKPLQLGAKNNNHSKDACGGGADGGEFMDVDPKDGFGVRNFQIQACKMATVSDIVVYGDAAASRAEVEGVARRISRAQGAWQRRAESCSAARMFNTFVLADDYASVEAAYPDLIALDSEGCTTGKVMDFFHWERLEMCSMSAPTEISPNVWLGPTLDPNVATTPRGEVLFSDKEFDIQVEASDLAQVPDSRTFRMLEHFLERRDNGSLPEHDVPLLEFPGSGAILPPTWSQAEVDSLMATCEWIYNQAHGRSVPRKRRDSKLSLSPSPERDADGDSVMKGTGASPRQKPGRKILIHCTDGYTESSLLALAYYMYAEFVPAHEAWLQLHREKGRDFFAYASDVALLRAIQPRILQASPKFGGDYKQLCPPVPDWLEKMDGSLPSRILPYMYLGNLGHANNPSLLKELGIGQILSVGEPVGWSQAALNAWGHDNLLFVDKVQDNGVDPLTDDFGRCLEFIANGRKNGTATLVHCRVGVSRSATICIAEVMNELGLSFPRAYCFVRARRLNVIIQPHLRFSYELLKWEEFQCQRRGKPLRRELEWATIAREIAAMNKPYSRQN